jgi:AMP nucleosidase
LFTLPLYVTWDGSATNTPKTRAYARFTHSGSYTTTIPALRCFGLTWKAINPAVSGLWRAYPVEPSQHEIPYPYMVDGSALTLDRSMSAGLTRHFPTTELSQIGDETADGIYHRRNIRRCRILMPDVWISRWRVYVTTLVRQPISSLLYCSPTTLC